MDTILHFYHRCSTEINVFLLLVFFIGINIYYLKKKNKHSFAKTLFALISFWLPFILTIIFILLVDNNKSFFLTITNNEHKVAVDQKWYFVLLSMSNNFLLLTLTCFYFFQIKNLGNYYYDTFKKHNGNAVFISCIVSILLNIFVFFWIYKFIKGEEPVDDILYLTQVASILNMMLFLVIDLIVLSLSSKIIASSSMAENIKNEVLGFKKTASFAVFNIDIACLLGVFIISIIQNIFLNIGDTSDEYPFSIGSVFFQIVITQIIFALYQSKRQTNE